MFELNLILLKKMGWVDYCPPHSSLKRYQYTFIYNIVKDIQEVKYLFLSRERKICFVIKEIFHDPKLKKNKKYNEYEFIIVDFSKKNAKIFQKKIGF